MLSGESRLWGVVMGALGITFVVVAGALVLVARRGDGVEPAPDGAVPAVTEDPAPTGDPSALAPSSAPSATSPASDAGAAAEPDPALLPSSVASGAPPKKATNAKTKPKPRPHRR